MLTVKQRDVLLFIHRKITEEGVSPSYEEMRDEFGMCSKSGVTQILSGLEERGFIKRLPNKARAIEILKLPPSNVVTLPVVRIERNVEQPWEQVVRSPELRLAIKLKASTNEISAEDQITQDLRAHYGLK